MKNYNLSFEEIQDRNRAELRDLIMSVNPYRPFVIEDEKDKATEFFVVTEWAYSGEIATIQEHPHIAFVAIGPRDSDHIALHIGMLKEWQRDQPTEDQADEMDPDPDEIDPEDCAPLIGGDLPR